MIFPGRKPLMEKIPTQNIRVDDLFDEFSKQNFSGYAEFDFPDSRGIILFHSGEIITAVYKGADKVKSQEEGIAAVKNRCRLEDGLISTFQLPAEMAHMLRGLCNRKFLDEIHVSGKLNVILSNLLEEKHTGTLDVLFPQRKEKGMILLINGRVSNTFLEMDRNLTLEGKEALQRVLELINEADGGCKIFKSDFSQEIWKSRRGTKKPHESRIFQILTEKETLQPSPMQALLSKLHGELSTPPYTAVLGEDGTVLAQASGGNGDGEPPADFQKMIQEAASLTTAVDMGPLNEILCTSQEKNLLIRNVPRAHCFHILIVDRTQHPKDLRKHLSLFDEEMAALSAAS
jgi:hypothetical protein